MKYYLPKGLTYNLISPDYPVADLAELKAAIQLGISMEQDWGVDTVAGPLTRWFEYSHGNIGGGKAWALEQAAKLGPGRPSPFFEALDNALQDGATLVRGSGNSTSLAYVEGQIDAEWKEPSRILLVLLAGGNVEGCEVFFELDDLDVPVPESFPGAEDETWETWGVAGESHKPVKIGDKWYRSSLYGQPGDPMSADKFVSLIYPGQSGIKVISIQDFVKIQQANNANPE